MRALISAAIRLSSVVRSCRSWALRCLPIMLAASLLGGIAPGAGASVFPPSILPADPLTDEPVYVAVQGGDCDAILQEPGYPRISREGGAIRIVVPSIHADDRARCIYDPPGTARFDLGTYPAGAYTVQVDRRYEVRSGLQVVETVGTRGFTVRDGPRSSFYIVALAAPWFLLVCASAWIVHRRRSGLPLWPAMDRFLLPALAVAPIGCRAEVGAQPAASVDRLSAANSSRVAAGSLP